MLMVEKAEVKFLYLLLATTLFSNMFSRHCCSHAYVMTEYEYKKIPVEIDSFDIEHGAMCSVLI